MIIRDDQLEALSNSKGEDFVERLMKHFEKVWPENVKALGGGYKQWIESGVTSAGRHGLNTEQTVARYVNLWFVWGKDFENDPKHAWAKEILEDAERGAHIKVHQLSYETKTRLEAAEVN